MLSLHFVEPPSPSLQYLEKESANGTAEPDILLVWFVPR